MNSDLCVIVPTKGRPHLIPRLLEAIKATADELPNVILVVGANETEAYMAVKGYADIWVVNSASTYPEKLNLAAGAVGVHWPYLALWNDDHVPETLGWDTIMKAALQGDKFGVAYGPDGIWSEGEIPSAPVITSSMVRALGWVALPGLHHILVDNVWKTLAEQLGTLHFLPEVMIRHHHRTNGLAPNDATYRQTGDDKAKEAADSERYWTWIGSPEYYQNIEDLKGL